VALFNPAHFLYDDLCIRKKNIYFANSKNNNNTNVMCKHRGGFPEGQSPIVLDTLSNAEYQGWKKS